MEQTGSRKQRHAYTGTEHQLWAGLNQEGFQAKQAFALSTGMLSYQEFSPLLPMAALGIGAAVGLRGNVDQIPLFRSGLWSLL